MKSAITDGCKQADPDLSSTRLELGLFDLCSSPDSAHFNLYFYISSLSSRFELLSSCLTCLHPCSCIFSFSMFVSFSIVQILYTHQSSGDGRPPPPPVTPTSFFRSEQDEDTWAPTAPPLPNTTSRHRAVYAEELHLPPSPTRSNSSSGHREHWLRFRRSRGT
ncbi:hypothetical protein Hanom_Chr13g01228891 [Helianthus anomalus]